MRIFDKPLKVGKNDIYTVTVDEEWLDGQTLNNATCTTSDTNIATNEAASILNGSVVAFRITGVAEGFVELDVTFDTINRSDCVKVGLNVVDC